MILKETAVVNAAYRYRILSTRTACFTPILRFTLTTSKDSKPWLPQLKSYGRFPSKYRYWPFEVVQSGSNTYKGRYRSSCCDACCRKLLPPLVQMPDHLFRDARPRHSADGHSYEREAITQWLLIHDTSPSTNAQLPNTTLAPNHALRNSIEEWSSSLQGGPQGGT